MTRTGQRLILVVQVVLLMGGCGEDKTDAPTPGIQGDVASALDPRESQDVPETPGPVDAVGLDPSDVPNDGDSSLTDATDGVTTDSVVSDEEVAVAPPVVVYVSALEGESGSGTPEDPYRDLQVALNAAPDGAQIQIMPGTFEATASPYADPGCGNCDDASFHNGADATKGFYVEGKSLHLQGSGAGLTILVTNAGYGLLFDGAGSSSVRDLSVTGGKRDADGNATDAGIVVRMTTLVVEQVSVVANDDLYTGPLPDPVVGVGGIFGREGSVLTVRNSIIEDNSWDGIALYRGAPDAPETAPKAIVEGCRIGCNPPCGNGGRGAGIGVTWDAEMIATGNVIHHYWKGIGTFGESSAELYSNVVRDQLGWGVIATGESNMVAINNVIVRNGTTGLSAWNAGVTGMFANNVVTANGTSADEWVGVKAGIWFNASSGTFALVNNLSWGNDAVDACEGGMPNTEPCVPIPFDGVDGNLVLDPLFVDASANDWHLQASSPAIDAGVDWLEDLDGTQSDMGVYGASLAPESIDGP
ncbi:MAG: right-handed parallel beta-helix repeat-containing protein [Myxococcota bacterium]|nr:right-handed parallel beta-helix repeat-containing protein [Myxococcota bacterium]